MSETVDEGCAQAKVRPGQWPVVELTQADWPDIRALFQAVFGSEMPEDFQRWKFGDHRGANMGMRDAASALVAHYGGIYRPFLAQGQRCTAIQMVDVMVLPTARDVFARFGPFGRVARTFIDQQICDAKGVALGFGFPNVRAMRLGLRLGLYHPFEPMLGLQWPLPGDGVRQLPEGSSLSALDWGQAAQLVQLDRLAQSHMAACADLMIPVRDTNWWRHRYANHPVHVHQTWWLTLPGKAHPSAAFVVRVFGPGQHMELMDWVVEPGLEAQVALLPAVLALAARHGAPLLDLWATQAAVQGWSPDVLGAARRSEACVVAIDSERVLSRPISDWLGKVWMTGGDTDFR